MLLSITRIPFFTINFDIMEPRTSSGMTKFVTALRRPLQNDRHNIKSTQEWRNNEPQRIPGDYLVPERLEAALKRNWQNQYAVEVRFVNRLHIWTCMSDQ